MMSQDSIYLQLANHGDFEQILTNPYLDLAARVWEDDRYEVFRTCYRSMRLIDDLVDQRKEQSAALTQSERERLESDIRSWLDDFCRDRSRMPQMRELTDAVARYKIPKWPWVRLADAMIYDLYHDGFATFLTFRRYTEGAAIAPASVFMHLCGIRSTQAEVLPPPFDIRKAALPLALFSYLVHIMRDFQKDQLRSLHYFADNLLAEHGLNRDMLYKIAAGGKIGPAFRKLMERYLRIAGYYRSVSRRTVDSLGAVLGPRYALSLELIYNLYDQVFRRIDPQRGTFSAEELNPSQDEVRSCLENTITRFSTNN